jgi:tRNA(fMet)-specific endonuclease VapC
MRCNLNARRSKKPEATKIAQMTEAFFAEVSVLPFTEETARTYAALRVSMERTGKSLGPYDMLIAAHALSVGATLVSADRAFRFAPGLAVEDWTVA